MPIPSFVDAAHSARASPATARGPPSTAVGRLRYHAGMFGLDTVVVLLVVLAIVLVWRGPRTLPRWGEVLGRGVRAARREAGDLRRDAHQTDGAPKP
jgi:hypothetical protein